MFGNNGPCFYKIIFGKSTEELRIPPHFMKQLVHEKASRATLTGPYDDLWTVVLRKKETGTYLQDGWPDFMRYHSLGNSEFLLFQYQGSLHFTVRIFDPSGLERVGSSITGKHQEAEGSQRKNKIDSIDLKQLETCITENASAGRKKWGKPRKNNVDPIELRQIEAEKDQINLRQLESCKYAPDAAPEEKRKQGRPRKNNVDPIELRVTEAEKDQINLCQLESCKYPPDAAPEEKRKQGRPRKNREIDTLIPHQLESCKEDPEAASSRKRKRGIPRKNREIDTLIPHQLESCKEDPEGASSRKRKPGRPRKKKDDDLIHQSKSCKYGEGMNFPCHKHKKYHSTNIKHINEKIKEEEMEPTVRDIDSQLEDTKEETDKRKRKKRKCKEQVERHLQTMRPPTEEERARVQEKANSFISKFPCYKCCLKQFNVQKMFLLPIFNPFSEAHFPPFKTHTVLRDLKGKGWVVTVVPVAGRHSFSGGWRSFAIDNRLEEGDVCIFELVKRNEMQVHVFRVRQS